MRRDYAVEDPGPRPGGGYRLVPLLLTVCLAGSPLAAQVVRQVGIGGVFGPSGKATDEDQTSGSMLLPESASLNRILERATDFFAREKWEDGTVILQGLLEGRLRVAQIELTEEQLDDPERSVYSASGRLYMPFAQYCQQLLCRLPAEGLEAYRLLTDAKARDALAECKSTLDIEGLTRLVDLYFATSYGPEIVASLADLHRLRGNLPEATHLRQRLLDMYPDLDDSRIRSLLLHQVHDFALLGDEERYGQAYKALTDRDPDATYRIRGELVSVAKLPENPAFRLRDGAGYGRPRESIAGSASEHGLTGTDLEPLWVFKFTDDDPYGLRPKQNKNQSRIFSWGRAMILFPNPKSFLPGTTASTLVRNGRRAVLVKDHDQLVMIDLLSGMEVGRLDSLGRSTDRINQQYNVRARTPVTDIGLQRINEHRGFLYFTTQNKTPTQQQSGRFPFTNKFVRYDPVTGAADLYPTESKKRLFFQTPPIGYRDWLYAPVRSDQAYCLARIEADTGKVMQVVTVHSGGSPFLRVPAVPPVRVGHQLVYMTNAGAVASYSLPDLKLQWLRVYETHTPHQRPVRRPRTTRGYGVQTRPLTRWKPILPLVFGGRVILAPTDSDALLCLNLHSGEVLWTLPRIERDGLRSEDFHGVPGTYHQFAYLTGDYLQCIDMVTGRRLWEVPLDQGAHVPVIGSQQRGRGIVAAGSVYLPFSEGVARFSCEDGSLQGVMKFPPFGEGDKRLKGPLNLLMKDSVLLAMTDSKVVAFTVPEDMVALARSGMDRVRRFVAAGRIRKAVDYLAFCIAGTDADQSISNWKPKDRRAGLGMFVRLSGEVAEGIRGNKPTKAQLGKALEVLDRCTSVLEKAKLPVDPRLILFRIELLAGTEHEAEIRDLREKLTTLSLVPSDPTTPNPDRPGQGRSRR